MALPRPATFQLKGNGSDIEAKTLKEADET
jgi:hypothetical protein